MVKIPEISGFPALSKFDPITGVIESATPVSRYLSDMRGYYADTAAYEAQIAKGNPLLYTVYSVEPADGEGDLMYGVGVIQPGRIGDEYYMTKGHYHAWRPAAEFYIGLSGEGLMLMEDEQTGHSWTLPLTTNGVAYVPGSAAHRTINTGTSPLVYIGMNPARAGHDYGSIAERNFRKVVVAVGDQPQLLDRDEFLARLRQARS